MGKQRISILCMIALIAIGCRTIKYVPIETVNRESRNITVRDSIFRFDSIIVKEKGDTVFMERNKYLFRYKIVKDSVFVKDTICIPYPVEVTKQLKAPLSGWQNFQVWCGRISLIVVLVFVFYVVLIMKKKLWF